MKQNYLSNMAGPCDILVVYGLCQPSVKKLAVETFVQKTFNLFLLSDLNTCFCCLLVMQGDSVHASRN